MKKMSLKKVKKFAIYAKNEFSTDIHDDDTKYHKVKGHSHFTGKYRETSHNICNLRYKTQKKILAVFHNGSKYDYHFTIKEFKINTLGDYHDLYVQSDTLLLADTFENFRNKCIDMYKLDPAHFLSAPGLA